MIRRLLRALKFYIYAVGVKNALFVELPIYIDLAIQEPMGSSFFESLIEWLEDCEDAYFG